MPTKLDVTRRYVMFPCRVMATLDHLPVDQRGHLPFQHGEELVCLENVGRATPALVVVNAKGELFEVIHTDQLQFGEHTHLQTLALTGGIWVKEIQPNGNH